MIASEVTNDDIAKLQRDLETGVLGRRRRADGSFHPSRTNARLTRLACISLFKWAAEAGRKYVTASPCVNLPKLKKSTPRTRVLDPEEIKTLWHGLEHPDAPCSRPVALAIKFMLTIMLRQAELLPTVVSELQPISKYLPPRALLANNLPADMAHVRVLNVPPPRVKKRRRIMQPLTPTALQILEEAKQIAQHKGTDLLFSHDGENPLNAKALGQALRGVKYKGKVKRLGIIEWLGMKKFTPHDLRRTAATYAETWAGCSVGHIAYCLDHQDNRDKEAVGTESTGVYVLSQHIPQKLDVLTKWEAELLHIVGADTMPAPTPATTPQLLKLVA
jgi:integrase